MKEIPRIVHAIWVGTEPPDWVLRRWGKWEAWCADRDIEFRAWDNEAVSTLNRTIALGDMPHPVMLSDFARLEIMAKHGGVYTDSDTVPLPGAEIDDLLGARPAWAVQLFNSKVWEVGNGCFGFPPGHMFMAEVWKRGKARLGQGFKRISSVVGPLVWTKVAKMYADDPSFEVLGPHRFNTELDARFKTLEQLAQENPDILVVNEFEQSWQPSYAGHGVGKRMPLWERMMMEGEE